MNKDVIEIISATKLLLWDHESNMAQSLVNQDVPKGKAEEGDDNCCIWCWNTKKFDTKHYATS